VRWGRHICALLVAAAAGAAFGQEPQPLAARIDKLLSSARSAQRLADAEARLDEAARLLQEQGGGLDAIERGFLAADVLRMRGRAAAGAWRRDPSRSNRRTKARAALLAAIEAYGALVTLCEGRLDVIEKRLGYDQLEKDTQWRTLRGYVSRVNYCEAWSLYRLGLVAETPAMGRQRFEQAVERFSSFTAKGYRNHPIVADCFLGQALCHFELGQHFRVLELLKPARPDNTPAALFQRMTYLRIRAGLAYGSYLATENAARQYFRSLGARKTLDAVELGMCLERAKCLAVLADPNKNPEYHKLFRGRLDEVARLVYAHGEPWRTELEHVLGTGKGASPFKSLTRTRALFSAGKYAEAVAEADKGLRVATAATDPLVLADLRYARCAALANLGEHVRAFRAMWDFLRRHGDDRRAAEVCASAVRTGRKALGEAPPLPTAELLALLDLLPERFPSHAETKRLAWHRASVLLHEGKYADVERVLADVKPSSDIYALAQYGRAAAAAKLAETLQAQPPADPNAMASLLGRASAAIKRFAAAVPKDPNGLDAEAAATIADVGVATARRYLALPAARPAEALAVLAEVDKLPGSAGRLARTRQVLRIRAQLAAGQKDEALAAVAALFERGTATGPAADGAVGDLGGILDALTERMDQLRADGKDKAAADLGEQVVRIQQELLRRVSASPGPQREARETALRFRLAETLRALGRHAQAATQYEGVLRRIPRREAGRTLRGLALCHENLGRPERAAELWAELGRGLEKGAEAWYEARYHWIRCLHRQGRRADARKLLTYFRLQHPKIASAAWRKRFDELAGRIGLPAGTNRAGAK